MGCVWEQFLVIRCVPGHGWAMRYISKCIIFLVGGCLFCIFYVSG